MERLNIFILKIMRFIIYTIIIWLSSMAVYAQVEDKNYIKTSIILDNNGNESVSYLFVDGLGRPFLTATNGQSSRGNFTSSLTEYDQLGRESWQWYPIPSENLDTLTVQKVKEYSSNFYGDPYAYSFTEYDLLGRKTALHKGGSSWKNNDKKVTILYSRNTNYEVKKYNVTNNTLNYNGYYEENTLTVECNTDEEGHTRRIYKNAFDEVVMTDEAGAQTYYVYNNKGLLSYVLTPQYQESENLELDAYKYEYDSFDRVSAKSMPGCEPVKFTYNDNDQISIEQSPLLKEKGLIRFFCYDKLGRLCVQGVCSESCYVESQDLTVSTLSHNNSENTCVIAGYVNSSNRFSEDDPNLQFEIINYYDDYSFLEEMPSETVQDKLSNSVLSGSTFSKGLLTGQIIATTDNKSLYSSYYYNYKGRVVDERHSTLDGDIYKVTTEYSFTDKPVRTAKVLHYGQTDSYPIYTYYEYNEHNDQLEQVTVSQGGRSEIVSKVTYNDLGQMATESRANNSDMVSYTYELHGWTKNIISPFFEEELHYNDAINGAVSRYNGDISAQSWKVGGKKHSYAFTYDDRDMLTNAVHSEIDSSNNMVVSNKYSESASYNANGGITSLVRRGKNNNNQYDDIDRLSYEYNGNQVKNITDGVVSKLSYIDAFEYRDAHKGTATSPDFVYNSSGMLVKDLDKGISKIIYNNIGLVDSICFSNGDKVKYVYAMTGEKVRMTHYTSRAALSSSRLELDPESATALETPANTLPKTANNPVTYSSVSSGPGLAGTQPGIPSHKINMAVIKSSETTYIGGDITIDMGRKHTFLFGGGYCEFKPDVAYADSIKYYYYTKDHLGNIRNVISKNDNGQMEELQVTHYYPFGGIIADISTGRNVQDHLYNGKELDSSNNLYWYDYGARQYDATRGQFTTPDPLAEKYYGCNIYVYCMNNPVKYIDPDGRTAGDFYDDKGRYLGSDGKDDHKVYILKTSEKSFGERASLVPGAGLNKSDAEATKTFIKTNNGNTEAFTNNPIAYNNTVEIVSSQSVRKSMVNHVSKDNGKGGLKDANNREYGGEIRPDGINFLQGDVFSPKANSYAFIELNTTDYSTFHGHPSGCVIESSNPFNPGTINMSSTTTTYSFTQSPSPIDIQNAGANTHYVMGRANGTTYIYNTDGVQATIPTKKFIKIP